MDSSSIHQQKVSSYPQKRIYLFINIEHSKFSTYETNYLTIHINILPYIVFCQSSNDEYFILTEYYYNDEGKQILIPTDSIEYHRITNKDHSMWGFKNKEGKIMIPPGKYSFLNPIDEHGMILAQKMARKAI